MSCDDDDEPRSLRNFRPVHEMPEDEFWGAPAVKRRLIDAARVIAQTPGRVGPRGFGATVGDEDLVEREPPAPIDVSPRRMSLAEQAIDWPLIYLADQPGMRRVLSIYLFCRVYRLSFGRVIKRRGWARATADRRRDDALRIIAGGLNRDSVPVEVM